MKTTLKTEHHFVFSWAYNNLKMTFIRSWISFTLIQRCFLNYKSTATYSICLEINSLWFQLNWSLQLCQAWNPVSAPSPWDPSGWEFITLFIVYAAQRPGWEMGSLWCWTTWYGCGWTEWSQWLEGMLVPTRSAWRCSFVSGHLLKVVTRMNTPKW